VAGVLYLAEFYFPGSEAALADLARRAHAAATAPAAPDIAPGAGCAGFVLAIHVPADEICFALYDAQGADAVLSAGARAGITFERVTAAILLAGPGQSVRWLA
jgi:hypothetical protein